MPSFRSLHFYIVLISKCKGLLSMSITYVYYQEPYIDCRQCNISTHETNTKTRFEIKRQFVVSTYCLLSQRLRSSSDRAAPIAAPSRYTARAHWRSTPHSASPSTCYIVRRAATRSGRACLSITAPTTACSASTLTQCTTSSSCRVTATASVRCPTW